jgi:hypothetical protein
MQVGIEFNTLTDGQIVATPYFTGDSSLCPPLPRMGEIVNLANVAMKVTEVVHNVTFDQASTPVVAVVVTLSNEISAAFRG